LAAKTLAMAATSEGRQVMMSSHYGGEMRGGQTEASVVVSDGRLRSVPILESAGAAYVMHHRYWPGVRSRLRPGAPVVYNSSVVADLTDVEGPAFAVAAGEIAAGELGAPMAAGFVLLGALAVVTATAGVESLVSAMKDLVPPYRTEHVAKNESAIRAGAEAGTRALAGAA
jgi:2-oxoglutarate ferredoxin oxidoreductase subunit gamma